MRSNTYEYLCTVSHTLTSFKFGLLRFAEVSHKLRWKAEKPYAKADLGSLKADFAKEPNTPLRWRREGELQTCWRREGFPFTRDTQECLWHRRYTSCSLKYICGSLNTPDLPSTHPLAIHLLYSQDCSTYMYVSTPTALTRSLYVSTSCTHKIASAG